MRTSKHAPRDPPCVLVRTHGLADIVERGVVGVAERQRVNPWSDPAATLNDLRESVTMLEDMERIARRVLGGAHPLVVGIERTLRAVQAVLRAREDA